MSLPRYSGAESADVILICMLLDHCCRSDVTFPPFTLLIPVAYTMSSPSQITVVVTGATGYVAGPLIELLIAKGYNVRGTVRSLDDVKSEQLKHHFPSLHLFEADLLIQGFFKDAIDGCTYVFHTASPFQHSWKDPEADFIIPAVSGTSNVLQTALGCRSVSCIVVTSSCATIFDWTNPAARIVSEKDYPSNTSLAEPYSHSKVLAEKKAYEIVDAYNSAHSDRTVRLVTILPSVILGPPIGGRVDGVSVDTITKLLDQSQTKSGVGGRCIPDVDVRDVAMAHVAAAEIQSAQGRCVLSNASPRSHLDYSAILKAHMPNRTYADKHAVFITMARLSVDHGRAEKELGVRFTPIEKTVRDMADRLVQLGLVKP